MANRLKQYTPPAWLRTKDIWSGEAVKEPEIEAGGVHAFDINLIGEFYARR